MSSQTKSESLTKEPKGKREVIPVREIGLLPVPAFKGAMSTEENETLFELHYQLEMQ